MPESSDRKNFDKMSSDDVLEKLNSNVRDGLSTLESSVRLKQYGENSLEEQEESLWKKLGAFFWGPIPWMIEAAAILSIILQKWPDVIMIVALLLINAILGFFQEFKAGTAISALKNKLALQARVLREGKWQDVDAKKLVPGDIVLVKLGNIIPADMKLVSGEYLSVDQSSLTGESLPVNKKVDDVIYSGTVVKLGEMVGVVINTGMNTFFGKTAKLVSLAKTKSHFQEAILKIGNFLIFATLAVAAVILCVSLYRMEISKTDHETIGQIIIFILVLIVAGIPVALPAVLSVTMAIGAGRLTKLKAIVSKLTAIEELAGMDLLCSDKTGTLTKNQLTIGDVRLFDNAKKEELLLFAALASKSDGKDAIDDAVIGQLRDKSRLEQYTCEKFIPFDPINKRTESHVQDNRGFKIKICKGAPQVVLKICNPSFKLTQEVDSAVDEFAAKGYRTIGVAKAEKDDWHFLGLISLFDPPRDDTKETINCSKRMGVTVKMITGDHTAIARELSRSLDMGLDIVPVKELYADSVLPRTREERLDSANGFAEVFPEHKFEIVKTMQNKNHVVGMTGDGVNDAPALKQANVGIAVSNSTDAARAAADIVLTEPGLMVINHAIEESRRIFGRMKSYALYRISETCRLLFFLLFSMIAFNDHPLSALMIILIALLNDIPIMMIAYDHMNIPQKPAKWNMKEILTVSVGLSVIGVVSTFLLYWLGDRYWFVNISNDHEKFYMLRTLAFMAVLCGGNLTVYLTRNVGSIWSKPYPELKFLAATLFSLVIGTVVSIYGLGTNDFVGIGWKYVGLSWLYIVIWFVVCMFVKKGLYRTMNHGTDYNNGYIKRTSQVLQEI